MLRMVAKIHGAPRNETMLETKAFVGIYVGNRIIPLGV